MSNGNRRLIRRKITLRVFDDGTAETTARTYHTDDPHAAGTSETRQHQDLQHAAGWLVAHTAAILDKAEAEADATPAADPYPGLQMASCGCKFQNGALLERCAEHPASPYVTENQ